MDVVISLVIIFGFSLPFTCTSGVFQPNGWTLPASCLPWNRKNKSHTCSKSHKVNRSAPNTAGYLLLQAWWGQIGEALTHGGLCSKKTLKEKKIKLSCIWPPETDPASLNARCSFITELLFIGLILQPCSQQAWRQQLHGAEWPRPPAWSLCQHCLWSEAGNTSHGHDFRRTCSGTVSHPELNLKEGWPLERLSDGSDDGGAGGASLQLLERLKVDSCLLKTNKQKNNPRTSNVCWLESYCPGKHYSKTPGQTDLLDK